MCRQPQESHPNDVANGWACHKDPAWVTRHLELRREGPVQHTVQYSAAQPAQPLKWDGPIGTMFKGQGRACERERVRA